MTADEAVEYGLADEVEGGKSVAASISGNMLIINGMTTDLSMYRNPPKLAFLPTNAPPKQTPPEEAQTDSGLRSLFDAQRQITKNRR